MLCFITNKKSTESSKIMIIFIHASILMGDDVRYYFPGLCVVSETTMYHSRQASVTIFPHVSLIKNSDDSAKMVHARCCF